MVTRKRASTRKSTTTRKTTRSARIRRPTTRTYTRRRRPGLPTTIGAAVGTLVVATLLDASWPVRIGLAVAVVVAGLVYVVWKNRSEIVAAGSSDPSDAALTDRPQSPPTTPATTPDSPGNQGDSTHE